MSYLKNLLLSLLILCGPLRAESFRPLIFAPGMSKLATLGQIYSFDNSVERLTVLDILSGAYDERFQSSSKAAIAIGHPKTVQSGDTWIALRVDNQAPGPIALWIYGASSQSMTKAYILPKEGSIPLETFSFSSQLRRTAKTLAIPPGTWKIYLELQREPYAYPMILTSLRTYENIIHQSPERAIILISLGICIALLLYNIVLAITLRSASHWLYVLYNLAIVFYFESSGEVLAEQFGTPAWPVWTWFPINSACLFFFALFVYDILNVSTLLSEWKKFFWLIFALWPVLLAWQMFDLTGAIRILNVLILAATPVSLMVTFHAIKRGLPIARLLACTLSLPAIGSLCGLLVNLFAPLFPLSLLACIQPLGIDLEMILLSMSVGYKIRRQHLALKRRRDHAYEELKKIVFPHQVQDVWNGRALESTMPVGSSEAYTIVFDVIGSSKMSIADPRAFMSGVFTACSELMMERYDGEKLVANAYRVKEMGDGFLCTVGFPFASPEPNAADHALRLSYRFMQTYAEHAARTGSPHPLYCAVGIAHGPIEAFYPDNGTKVYDMYGRSIILANRYESMRDYLFPHLKTKNNIVILQAKVWESLSPELQREFTHFSLDAVAFRVKDDEAATHFYYRLGTAPET